jgi:sigma-B regulation protein RsbU (phosphoserine phosphatase)
VLQRREVAPVVAALLVLLGVVVADAVAGEDVVLISLLVTAPLLAAAFTRPGVTGAIGLAAVVLAVVLAVGSGATAERVGTDDLVRVATIVASSSLAVLIAGRREQRESALLQMTVIADVAQNAVLWPVPPQLGSLQLAARYVSASAAARIGGDLYEVVDSPYGVRLIMGDVRGKGLPAVRLAAAVLGCFREVAYDRPALADVQAALSTTVERLASPEDFVTAVLVELDGECGRILSCGHPAPLLLHDGDVSVLEVDDPDLPLGLGSAGRTAPTTFAMSPGTRMLLHTDGLLEGRDAAGRFFPAEEHLRDLADASPPECLDGLLRRLADHCGGQIGDDVALLLVDLPAVPAPAPAAGSTPTDELPVPGAAR